MRIAGQARAARSLGVVNEASERGDLNEMRSRRMAVYDSSEGEEVSEMRPGACTTELQVFLIDIFRMAYRADVPSASRPTALSF